MDAVIVDHVPEQIDRKMLGFNQDVYSRPQLEGSRTSSSNTTPTSTAPPAVGSARLPASDIPAYINSQTPSHSSHTPDAPRPPSMTSSSHYGIPPDHPVYSHRPTPQQPPSGHAAADPTSMTGPAPSAQASPESPRLQPTYRSMQSVPGSEVNSPSRIRVQSLSHIQSLASEDFLAHSRSHIPGHGAHPRKFEISSMPVTDIIEMVAGLLTKITTTNDKHHEDIHRHIPPPDGTSNLSPQATSVLAFHGKNVPSISILSYLTRIHKYCPTTYEVFLSLLVYFDRMTELVNRGQSQSHWDPASIEPSEASARQHQSKESSIVTPPSSTRITAQDPKSPNSSISPGLYPQGEEEALSHFFVVDSFNIHRLVIAGVTCASKFFSDVFYTNSRYAKVGGLPLVELNHLELQFLLLNDFRLAVPVEELEAYGTMLVEFYAREIVAQQQQERAMAVPRSVHPSSASSHPEGMYMRSARDKRREDPGLGQTPTPP
ncbi:hypothetical protein N7532_011240 [Penicillium argentinense]|uniref:Cyclin-domain-containing protein n=1 Tax=Penicillium argentinense TaxID=1131581 RepID=A0A9W9EI20_9EURO|nr:uncharacterized protein N7532_011240 [Penicillium argentinense]KAJ5082197.1 hypothetical protein N7532_011240 [Penicillium argentinense]